MGYKPFLAANIVAFACSGAASAIAWQGTAAGSSVPVGVKVEGSGFWTIQSAPDSPAPPRVLPRDTGLSIYARIAGVSNAEAEKRRKAQETIRPEFERLMRTLRTRERGNLTDAELIHRPDWTYLIYFKRQPAKTLAKYTKNPRFKARSAPYTEAELRKLTKTWIDRLTQERLVTGYGMNARQGRADVDMVVSEAEFADIALRKGWGAPPAYLNLKFDGAPIGPDVDPSVSKGVRIFPHGDRNLGLVNQAALGGRIVLRDGCLFVIGFDGKEQLAYFAREVGLGLDRAGYLSLYTRTGERRHLGRIGERFTWAGPIHIDDTAAMVRTLRAQCGNAPLMHVGIPDSTAMFNARYGLPDRPTAPPRREGERPEPAIQPVIPA